MINDKESKELKKTNDMLEFQRDEYKSQVEWLKRENESLKNNTTVIDTSHLVVNDNLMTRIQILCADDPLFLDTFKTALMHKEPDKEFYLVILKSNSKTGKNEHIYAYKGDVPDLGELLDTYGPGKYRFVLKYWMPEKPVKGGVKRAAYATTFRDKRLGNPIAMQIVDAELSERLRTAMTNLINLASDLGKQYTTISQIMNETVETIKTLRELKKEEK